MAASLILSGIIGGIAGGLLGIGGGTIYVPILVLFFNTSQHLAQGVSLAIMVPMSILGAYTYYKQGSINTDIFFELCIGSIAGAFLGATLAHSISGPLLQQLFAIALGSIGFKMLIGK